MATGSLIAAKVIAAVALTVSLTACDSINIKLPDDDITVDVSKQREASAEKTPEAGQSTSDSSTKNEPTRNTPTVTDPKTSQPTKEQPAPKEPTKNQPEDDRGPSDDHLNVINVGDGPAYFYDPVSGSDCIISSTSVYCYTGGIEQFGKELDGTKICDPALEEETVHDAILADGKFWFGCSHEPIWTMYIDGTEPNYDFLVDWIKADKTGQHKPGLEKSDVSQPTLLPNTQLVSGKHTCTSSKTDLRCEDTTTGASFVMTTSELTVTKETNSYPLPDGIL